MTPPYPQPSSPKSARTLLLTPTSTGGGEAPAGSLGPASLIDHAQPTSQRPGAQIHVLMLPPRKMLPTV